jgi:octaprenyl-diphosphate synthase
MLSGCGSDMQAALAGYGRHLGIAFQMVDDVLDYTGDPEVTGKQVGDDLNEGKPTLPLIYTMTAGSTDDAALVKQSLSDKSSEHLTDVIAAVRRSGGIEYTQNQAIAHQQNALAGLALLGASPAKDALVALAELAVARNR